MARQKKPAKSIEGHTYSKSELEKRSADEEKLKGSSDLLGVAPDLISNYPTAVKYYNEILKYADPDVYGNVDRYGLAMVASVLADLENINRRLLEGSMERGIPNYTATVQTKAGASVKINPLITLQKQYMQEFSRLATQYGFSPSARAQLSSLTMNQRESENDEAYKMMMDSDKT